MKYNVYVFPQFFPLSYQPNNICRASMTPNLLSKLDNILTHLFLYRFQFILNGMFDVRTHYCVGYTPRRVYMYVEKTMGRKRSFVSRLGVPLHLQHWIKYFRLESIILNGNGALKWSRPRIYQICMICFM